MEERLAVRGGIVEGDHPELPPALVHSLPQVTVTKVQPPLMGQTKKPKPAQGHIACRGLLSQVQCPLNCEFEARVCLRWFVWKEIQDIGFVEQGR